MRSIIVIGAGIAAENFIFRLSLLKNESFSIIQLANDAFYPACATRSTAIVAGRGVSEGHSELGDILTQSYRKFLGMVETFRPRGVYLGEQWTGVNHKLDEFKKRYPDGEDLDSISSIGLSLKEKLYFSKESCFVIDPDEYLNWMRSQSSVTRYEDAAIEITKGEFGWEVRTANGKTFQAEYVFMGVGSYQRFWKEQYPVSSLANTSKTAQGSYLSYEGINLGEKYFSLTLNGDNLIYHPHSKKLIIGSTTVAATHHMPDISELEHIYENLDRLIDIELPSFDRFEIKTGLREKAKGRRPYLENHDGLIVCGGFYKNGYSLGPYFAEKAWEEMKR